MTPHTPEPTPEILSLMRACEPFINNSHATELARAFNPPPKGTPAAEPTGNQLEAVYATACRLCDEENYQFAAALALHLFAYKPAEPRYAFLAGNCMQRLGLNASAAKFFCYALARGGDHPAALFRLGESLLALGDRVNAERAFDAALDVSRCDAQAEDIQRQSNELVDLLRHNFGGPDAPPANF